MKILMVNPVGQIGGAERVLLDCIAAIRKLAAGLEIHLLLMDDGPLADEARALGAGVTVLPAPNVIRFLGDSAMKGRARRAERMRLIGRMMRAAPAMWRYARRLRRVIRRINPDVIHSNGLKSHLLIGQAKLQSPTLWHIHDFVASRPMIAKLLRRVAGNVTLVAVSSAVADDIRVWLPGSSPRVVLNGLDLARFSPGVGDGAMLDQLANLPAIQTPVIRIGLVATYARWKGQDVFLRAAAEILRQPGKTAVRFYIIGGPIYTTRGSQFSRDELVAISREVHLEEHVGFVPFQSDLTVVYRSLDIVVHASTQPEPFGLTIAQAMACGRAVVVSVGGGSVELFTEGVDAIGVGPGDVGALANALTELAEHPDQRAFLGCNARITAERCFDRMRMATQILEIYRTIAR